MTHWAIDLGTTNTGIAHWDADEGRPRLLELAGLCRKPSGGDPLEAPNVVPSAVHVLEPQGWLDRIGRWPFVGKRMFLGQQALIGRPALELNQGPLHPNFATGFKPYLQGHALRTLARVKGRPYSARDVARIFLRELLAAVRKQTGQRIRQLTITTPVEAFESYRAELVGLGKELGLKRIHFVDEPVAAALGYGLGIEKDRVVLVVDFGGGTLDLALVGLTARGLQEGKSTVLAKEGRALGGNDVDRWLLDDFCHKLDYPLEAEGDEQDSRFWYRLMLTETCRVKEALFFAETEQFLLTPPEEIRRFEAQLRGEARPLQVNRQDLRDLLEQRGLYRVLQDCLDGILAQAARNGVQEQDIDEVLMVGGSTLLPGVYPLFESRFGRNRVRAWQPFEAVAYGACVMAAQGFRQTDFIVHDYAFVTHDPKTNDRQYNIIIPRGTRFPTAPDFWKRQLVPTCSLGEPEKLFRLLVCEMGRGSEKERSFAWDAAGQLHKLGGKDGGETRLVVPLNESSPTLGHLDPPHAPSDRNPRLELSFQVNADRWLCATVQDLKTHKTLMNAEPVVRLL